MPLIRTSIPKSAADPVTARSQAFSWSRLHRISGHKASCNIVIPAYNEAPRIRPTIESIYDHFSSRAGDTFEVTVVDDGSTDDTRTVLQCFGSYRNFYLTPKRPNFGKGFSVRQGMLANTANRALFMDADGSTPISELPKLDGAFESGSDIAIGSRWTLGSEIKVHQPFYRETMGQTFNFIVRVSSGLGFDDTQCGFKAFTKYAAADIFYRQKLDRFAFDVELLYLAKKLGYKTTEVPIIWTDSPRSKVNPLTDSANMFLDVMRIRWMHRGIKSNE